jgi:hypothetical protein
MLTIGEIIQATQPKIYIILVKVFALDMLPEFRETKKLMEERRGFRL